MFGWFKSKKTVPSDNTKLFEAAIREVHPDRFLDELTAAVSIQPHLVALNTFIGRPPEERFFPVSFDDLVRSVRRFHHAGVLSQAIQIAGQDAVMGALLMAAIQERQPTARFRPRAEIILKYLNAYSSQTLEGLA